MPRVGCCRAACFPPYHRAKSGVKVRDTGVRFKDVAGIDAIQADIREVIDILLGDERYISMGAKPFRVSGAWPWGLFCV